MAEAYPLHWPPGRPRSVTQQRSQFGVKMSSARDGLLRQLRLLGAKHVVLSTNVALRQDGLPYANQKEPCDPGVSVYFEYRGKSMCFSCDRWDRVRDNVRAIERTIEAIRGIERWGTGEMVQAAFSGFEALPPPGSYSDVPNSAWWVVLGVGPDATAEDIRDAYKKKAREAGGTSVELNAARDAGLAARAA